MDRTFIKYMIWIDNKVLLYHIIIPIIYIILTYFTAVKNGL